MLPQRSADSYTKVYLVWHDQLQVEYFPEWVREERPLLLFIESAHKAKSRPYHKQKLMFVLSAMRHFALECHQNGYPVWYESTSQSFEQGLIRLLKKYEHWQLHHMELNEWDSIQALKQVQKQTNRVTTYRNTFFLADIEEFEDRIKKGWRMEFFYREMRRKTGYLMEGEHPVGGEWNYDKENRKKLPKNLNVPEIFRVEPDAITLEVKHMIEDWFPHHFGETSSFAYAVTSDEAQRALEHFLQTRLHSFGPYEDAMATGHSVLFHSQLSPYLNAGLLSASMVCEAALSYSVQHEIPIASIEGFIRQIIGWREYIRIYYHAMMPEIRTANYFGFTENLPQLFWDADTRLNCLRQCIKPVIEDAYTHHIPRLMVMSNFSNLTQTNPRQLNEWFWFSFIDAYEWVVLPNVLGMSTFADGGVLASKPYIAGGNYINKMSDYCSNCTYSVKQKTGDSACPFNYLYWNFIDDQRETFQQNGRANFMVNTFDKKNVEEKKAIKDSAHKFLSQLARKWNN
ncbi:MAG: cryptochrome/photolyase family protein [Bacteroidetes bacterium]|nr:cryptochrome/photolyase family protein [Bacteroidota bacterium]